MQRSRGFTLLEVMVVIVILGIIASITVPFVVVGTLFLIHYTMNRKSSN